MNLEWTRIPLACVFMIKNEPLVNIMVDPAWKAYIRKRNLLLIQQMCHIRDLVSKQLYYKDESITNVMFLLYSEWDWFFNENQISFWCLCFQDPPLCSSTVLHVYWSLSSLHLRYPFPYLNNLFIIISIPYWIPWPSFGGAFLFEPGLHLLGFIAYRCK